MALTNDLCLVHKRHSDISLGMNSKRCVDSRNWSYFQKQKNAIHFEYKRRNVARLLNYFKKIYTYKLSTIKAEKHWGTTDPLSLW